MSELMHKKHGRPCKYAPMAAWPWRCPHPSAFTGGATAPSHQRHQHDGFSISGPPSDPNAKRRDSSGKKKQFEALWGRTSSTWFLCPPLIFLNMQGKIYF